MFIDLIKYVFKSSVVIHIQIIEYNFAGLINCLGSESLHETKFVELTEEIKVYQYRIGLITTIILYCTISFRPGKFLSGVIVINKKTLKSK